MNCQSQTTGQQPHQKLKTSVFQHVQMTLADELQQIYYAYLNDTNKDKINLGIGTYRDDSDQPYLFKVVKEAQDIIRNGNFDKEYPHTLGLETFRKEAQNLLFGECTAVKEGRVGTVQTLSGTGAIDIGLNFFKLFLSRNVYISNPSWFGHAAISKCYGFNCFKYPYFDFIKLEKRFSEMIESLQNAFQGSIIILHACAHNPTGLDLTEDEWKQVAAVMKRKNHIPFFDCAYQGFATGDMDKDAWSVRYFAEQGFEMFVAHSFSKSMGLYGERIGALHVVTHDSQVTKKILSQMMNIAGNKYSTPPIHGALIAQVIMTDKKLKEKWLTQLRDVVFARINEMKFRLRDELKALNVPGQWDRIPNHIGMFFYSGLSRKQCELLIKKHHVYLLTTGRISMTGVNSNNVKRIAQAFKQVIEQAPRVTCEHK